MMAEATLHPAPNLRRWRDLSKLRLFLALAFAPIPSYAVGLLVIMGMSPPLDLLGGILAAAEIWSMLVGTLYLVLARLRGVVRRAHCLMLGAFLAFSLPYAAFTVDPALDWIAGNNPPAPSPEDEFVDDFEGPSNGAFALIVGIILTPFGTLGGWTFWRLGVYPAKPKDIDVAPVFD
jgi:hypothetical protein